MSDNTLSQPGPLYWYRALVTNIVDGDTIDVTIDLGLKVSIHDRRIRLYGINAPELKQPTLAEGKRAKLWLTEQIFAKRVTLRTIKDGDDKFGRLLGDVWMGTTNINRRMAELGLATPYMVGKSDMELSS